MASGWARDGAVQDQVDASVEDAVELARSRLPRGESLLQCEECGAEIPEGRREALPGVRLCVECQSERDRHGAPPARRAARWLQPPGQQGQPAAMMVLARRSVGRPVRAAHNAWREQPRTSTRGRIP